MIAQLKPHSAKMTHRLNQKEPHILTLIIMSSFAAMGAVILTPSLPQISSYFKISTGYSQLTVTLFLIGYALGQLIYGPLSNRLGRKRAFYVGIVIATLGSIASILSEPFHSFWFLILGRMLEALGSSAGLVIAFTIINDYYYPEQARKIISYMMLAFAIIPGVAIMVGGVLVTQFGWISCFYFLLMYGLTLLIPAHRLAETAHRLDPTATQLKRLIHNYGIAFKNKLLHRCSLIFGCTVLCTYVYAAAAPFIAIHTLNISAERFGFIGLIPFIGTGLGALTSAKLSQHFAAKTMIKIGVSIELIATLVMLSLFLNGHVSLIALIGCSFVFMFGGCFIMSNASSLATSTSEDRANASAVMTFINMSMPVFGTLILAMIPGSQVFKLPLILLAAIIAMSSLLPFIKPKA